MFWWTLKQNQKRLICPALVGRVEYRSTSYRYASDRPGNCYLAVDKKNILNMSDTTTPIRWYQTEQEIKNDPNIEIPVDNEEIEAIRKESKGIPEDRLHVIARSRKVSVLAKELLSAQSSLSKSNFTVAATTFLSRPIEERLESQDILLNILALVDRRVGKKRILNMSEKIKLKHPAVQYFYEIRRRTL